MLLADKVVIITGGASPRGIGKATAIDMAGHGARIAIVDLHEEQAAAAAADVGEAHRGYGCDVADRKACEATLKRIVEEMGTPYGLVCFAGISRSTRLMDISPEEYEQVMAVNTRGTMNMCQAAVPGMQAAGGGSIVTVGSIAAQRGGGVFGASHYSASKGAVQCMAKALARELAPTGIRVNAIAPGLIETDIFEGKLTEDRKAEIAQTIPMLRVGQPKDVATVCSFLVSDMAAYVTGVTLDINGGLHIH